MCPCLLIMANDCTNGNGNRLQLLFIKVMEKLLARLSLESCRLLVPFGSEEVFEVMIYVAGTRERFTESTM